MEDASRNWQDSTLLAANGRDVCLDQAGRPLSLSSTTCFLKSGSQPAGYPDQLNH